MKNKIILAFSLFAINISILYVIDSDINVKNAIQLFKSGQISSETKNRVSVKQVDLYTGVARLFSSEHAYAAIKNNGRVVCWGDALRGGDCSSVLSVLNAKKIKNIFSNERGFSALMADGSVVFWGDESAEKIVTFESKKDLLQSGVKTIYATDEAFAALKKDGSVVTWGICDAGGSSIAVADDLNFGVKSILATRSSFAALKQDGSVIVWGNTYTGGLYGNLTKGGIGYNVKSLYATSYAFSALKVDGTVEFWGYLPAYKKGSESLLKGNVSFVKTSPYKFSFVLKDGSVVES